jgi:hypothetical protein
VGGAGDQRLGGCRWLRHGDFFNQEIVLHFVEGGEGLLALEYGAHISKLLEDRENKCSIMAGLSQITKPIRHKLEHVTVFRDGEVSLHEVAEHMRRDERAILLVADELVFNDESGAQTRRVS